MVDLSNIKKELQKALKEVKAENPKDELGVGEKIAEIDEIEEILELVEHWCK